jgi:MgsA AAA+ ATPase C terminal
VISGPDDSTDMFMTSYDEEARDMAVGPWNMRTINGYAADECISALQKTIRRCDTDGAVYWSHELNMSGLGGWAWRRLMIICCEDIGLAEPGAPAVIAGLWAMSEVLRANQKKPEAGQKILYPPLQLQQATWHLARARKNREIADMLTLFEVRQQRNELMPMPDFALDKHSARGRAMGRDARHFEDRSPAGARWIENAAEVDGDRWQERFYAEWTPPPPGSRVSVPPGSQTPRLDDPDDSRDDSGA